MTDGERVAALRQRCLDRKERVCRDRGPWTAAALKTTEGFPWQVRMGRRTREVLANLRFEVDDLELLAGRIAPDWRPFTPEETAAAQEYLARFEWPQGQTGHCELDYFRLFSLGIDGIRADLERRKAAAADGRADVHESFILALDGLSALAGNAAAAAERAMDGASPERTAELRAIAASCRRVARMPPGSLRDAVQLMWFTIIGVMHGDHVGYIVPGHMDRTFLPFYRGDLERGAETRESALLLIESLYLLINEFVPDGGAVSVMVGGRDASGGDVTNDLSYLSLEALRRTRLVYPTVGVCWHEGTPEDLTMLAVRLIGEGYAQPAFFGDRTIRQGLEALGVPPEESCRYINSTCVEITPSGGSNVWVASPYFNVCRLLLEEIADEAADPAPSFDAFVSRYRRRLARAVEEGVAEENRMRRGRRRCGGKPLQSVFTRDCVERGRDIDDGGARYNWVECSFVGLANLADSLLVIREEVYRRGSLTMAGLKDILDADFAGREDVRSRFLTAHPKYGNGDADVDAMVGETVSFAVDECRKYRMEPDDAPFVPGAFVWVMHERLGRETGATPDGRRAGFPFADGCGPAQGRELLGPTAAILSTTSWDHSRMIGGLAYNMKFNKALFATPGSLGRLRDLIVTYLRRGGFETQVNVVSRETLLAARAHPEEYRDLVVRVGGYTDYFNRLSPEMQDEIILRTGFETVS